MKYVQPYGVSDPNAPYINGNPSTGTMGSIPPAASIEHPQREIVNMISAAELTPDQAVLNQLALAVQKGRVNYVVDTGGVNTLVATAAPVPGLVDGLVIRIKVKITNTGQTTFNLNGLGTRPVRRRGNEELFAGDLFTNAIASLVYNTTFSCWELIGVGGAGARGSLIANKTIYVNYAIGLDTNDGTANTAGKALKTIQGAFDLAWFYEPSQYAITIIVADSQLYPAAVTPAYPGPKVIMTGNVGAPTSVLISGGNAHALVVQGLNDLTITGGFSAQTNASGTPQPAACFLSANGAIMQISGCRSVNCDGAVFEAFNGSMVVGSHTFGGGSNGNLFWAMSNGTLDILPSAVFTFAVNPLNVEVAAVASHGGVLVVAPPAATFANPGYVVGPRYYANLGGVIGTSGGGVNYFPGTVAGTVANGGVYA